MNKIKTCYACDAVAISDEHVPPKCLFPHKKYLPKGCRDLRKNLITVPSCKMHNADKKLDDEYLGCFLALSSDDRIAYHYFTEKWLNTLQKNNNELLNRFLENYKKNLKWKTGENTIGLQVEIERIVNSIKRICQGLYYHQSNFISKLLGDNWHFSSLNLLDNNLKKPHEFGDVKSLRNLFIKANHLNTIGFGINGSNKDVFFYQKVETNKKVIFRLVFYFYLEFYMFYIK